jgi:uncharacterized protein YecE (DUF72 family)
MKIDIPEPTNQSLRLGTCSWKFDSWKGLYYEPGKNYRPDDYLLDYARHLNSVEIDQWFWSLFPGGAKLPEQRVVKSYAAGVPDDFIFTVKAPNSLTLTHFYSKPSGGHGDFAGKPNPHFLSNQLLDQFLERLASKMPSKEVFFERIGEFIVRAPKGFQYALETRNPNYLSSAFFQFLKENHLGFVYLEGYYMPPIGEVFARYKPVTADFSIIRLHGGDRLEMETETGSVWDKIASPKPEGIEAAVRIVRHNIKRKILTFVNVNNHFEGSAPLSIERFVKALE